MLNTKHPLLKEEFDHIASLALPFEELRGKRIAVTGANGLIGSTLLRALHVINAKYALGMRLMALTRNCEKTQSILSDIPGLETVFYDACRSLSAPIECDHMIHAASNAHPMAFSSDPVGTMRANLTGTLDLLENAKTTGCRVIMISSGEIYGEAPNLSEGFDEHNFGSIDPMNPRSCYPESKRAAETLCAAYVRQYNVDALSARLTYVFGPSITEANSRADAQFLRKAISGEDIVLKSEGTQTRTYLYAPDAIAGLITLMLRGVAGEAYNVSDAANAVSIREYAETLAEIGGVQVVFDLPPESERRGYSVVTRAILRGEKLRSLGWTPNYSVREGLRRTFMICADRA